LDRSQQRVITRFLDKEKVQPDEIHRRLAAQACQVLYPKQSIEWWYAQVVLDREEIEDDHRPGRPPIDHLDTTVNGKTLPRWKNLATLR
jgi:hypothetical protein